MNLKNIIVSLVLLVLFSSISLASEPITVKVANFITPAPAGLNVELVNSSMKNTGLGVAGNVGLVLNQKQGLAISLDYFNSSLQKVTNNIKNEQAGSVLKVGHNHHFNKNVQVAFSADLVPFAASPVAFHAGLGINLSEVSINYAYKNGGFNNSNAHYFLISYAPNNS